MKLPWRTEAPRPAAGSTEPTPARETAEHVLRRLEWTVLKRLDGLFPGDARTLLRGGGVDLADLREYQPHDDVRRIDWNVTARLRVPHVREFHEDRDMTVWFLMDASESVGFGSGTRSKRALAGELAAVLARLFTRAGHRVGALVLHGPGARPRVLPARGGRAAVLGLIEALQQPAPANAGRGLTDINPLLAAAEHAIKRRGVVFVLSDFISHPGWEPALGRLSMRHELLAVRVVDPWERELPALGLLNVQDAETGEALLVDFADAGFRARYAALAAERNQALQGSFARAGADAIEMATDEDLLAVLQRQAALRRLRQRRAVRTASPTLDAPAGPASTASLGAPA